MRGFPLLNLIGILALLALMAVPLVAISRRQAAPAPVVAPPPETVEGMKARSTVVTLVLVHPASAAALWKDGRMLWQWADPLRMGTRLETTLDLPYFEGTVEFELRLQWPQGTPRSVVEVTLSPEGLDAKTQNAWGDGGVEELVSQQWKEAP